MIVLCLKCAPGKSSFQALIELSMQEPGHPTHKHEHTKWRGGLSDKGAKELKWGRRSFVSAPQPYRPSLIFPRPRSDMFKPII